MPVTSQPHTITPSDSDSEEAQAQLPKSHFSPWSSSPTPSEPPSFFQPLDGDDMMVDAASPSSTHQDTIPSIPDLSDLLAPGPFHPDAIAANIAGRMPTPIQPNFAAQVRGVWGGPGPALHHPNGLHNLGHQPDSAGLADPSIPRTMGAANPWIGAHSRRLPSPISEGEDMCSPTGTSGLTSPGMVLDSVLSSQLNERLQRRRDSDLSPKDMGMMDVEEEHDVTTTTLTLTQTTSAPTESNSAPATPSPGRRGHIRSRHTVNNWTLQPGMKKSFSIGYRADCEKCRLKVPGHFNHIIIS